MPGYKKDAEPKVDHLTQEEPFPRLHRIFLRVRPTHDVRMLALIAIMKVGIEVRAAPMRHLQATTIAIGDVKTQEMTDANTNAILEFDTSARGRRRTTKALHGGTFDLSRPGCFFLTRFFCHNCPKNAMIRSPRGTKKDL